MFDAPQEAVCLLASRARCWLLLSLMSMSTPRPTSAGLLSSHFSPSWYLWPAVGACFGALSPSISILLFFSPVSEMRYHEVGVLYILTSTLLCSGLILVQLC